MIADFIRRLFIAIAVIMVLLVLYSHSEDSEYRAAARTAYSE